jgi:hypothetical protein
VATAANHGRNDVDFNPPAYIRAFPEPDAPFVTCVAENTLHVPGGAVLGCWQLAQAPVVFDSPDHLYEAGIIERFDHIPGDTEAETRQHVGRLI